jgi:hypothetical protein
MTSAATAMIDCFDLYVITADYTDFAAPPAMRGFSRDRLAGLQSRTRPAIGEDRI